MIDAGLLDEVRALVERGFGAWLTATQAIGYAEFAGYLAGGSSLDEAVAGTVRRTRELARRQMVWFRRDPRIRWFGAGPDGDGALVDEVVGYLRG
jgi:tRNA dimethylallyltransferase